VGTRLSRGYSPPSSLKNSKQLRKDLRAVWERKDSPDVDAEMKKINRELATVNRKIDKATDYMLENDDTSDIWHKRFSLLQEHRETLETDLKAFQELTHDTERRIEELEEMFRLLDSVTLTDIWDEGLPEERRAIVNTYLKGIYIYRDRCEIEFVNIPRFKVWWDEVNRGKVRVRMEQENRVTLDSYTAIGC
jgi:predicted nuclease with TOPRIM domain